jgi:hypothetical protein
MKCRWPHTARVPRASTFGLTCTVIAAALTLSACTSADGDVSAAPPPVVDATQSASPAAPPFYVEFRTRPYFSITHIFLVYGAQDPSGHPLELKTVGFYPHGGAFGPFIGMVGIAGEVGQEDYYAKLPSSTVFHRNLTTEQYQHLTQYIDAERTEAQVYNLFFNNCNDFVAGAADAIGLKVPFLHALPPPLFIRLLAGMNT